MGNKITKVRSFKSSEYSRMKVDGPYFEVSAKTVVRNQSPAIQLAHASSGPLCVLMIFCPV